MHIIMLYQYNIFIFFITPTLKCKAIIKQLRLINMFSYHSLCYQKAISHLLSVIAWFISDRFWFIIA